MAATNDWERRIANEHDPVRKAFLIRMRERAQGQASVGVTKFDPSLMQGGKAHCVPKVHLYVHSCEAQTIEKNGKKFSITTFECDRRCLPIVEASNVKGKIEVTSDLSAILFSLPHVSEWTRGSLGIASATGRVSVRMIGHAPVSPGWHSFIGFSIEQKRGAGKDGILYTNVSCTRTEPWLDAPPFHVLHRLCCKLWTNERFMPRPIDPAHYPPQEMINHYEQELLEEKSLKSSSSSSSSSSADPEAAAAPDYELYSKAFAKALDQHLHELGIDWQRHPELRQQVPHSRHPYVIPLILGERNAIDAGMSAKTIETSHGEVFFPDDFRVMKGGNEVKLFEPSSKNPFTMHLTAAATTSVTYIDVATNTPIGVLTLAIAMRGTTFFHHLIVNPFVAQGVLPRVLPKTPMTIVGSPNMQTTRDKDTEGFNRTLVVDVFNAPIIDYLAMLRDVCVQVTPAYAVQKINEYVKSQDPSAKIVEGKAKAAMLLNNDPGRVQEHIFAMNKVSRATNNQVFNCFENKITVTAKKSGNTHRFYAMTGLIPNEDLLAEYRRVQRAYHECQDDEEQHKLAVELYHHVETITEHLSKAGTGSEWFQANPGLTSCGIAPTTVIWAVSRELDHVTSSTDYTNEAFSLEAVVERSNFIAGKSATTPAPTPAPAPVEPSVEESAPASSVDDMDEPMATTEERPKGRKRRDAPGSPVKKTTAAKKDRSR